MLSTVVFHSDKYNSSIGKKMQEVNCLGLLPGLLAGLLPGRHDSL